MGNLNLFHYTLSWHIYYYAKFSRSLNAMFCSIPCICLGAINSRICEGSILCKMIVSTRIISTENFLAHTQPYYYIIKMGWYEVSIFLCVMEAFYVLDHNIKVSILGKLCELLCPKLTELVHIMLCVPRNCFDKIYCSLALWGQLRANDVLPISIISCR